MGKTTVKPGNSHYGEGGRMPSTTGKPSGGDRGNNLPSSSKNSNSGKGGKKWKSLVSAIFAISCLFFTSCEPEEKEKMIEKTISIKIVNTTDVDLNIESVDLYNGNGGANTSIYNDFSYYIGGSSWSLTGKSNIGTATIENGIIQKASTSSSTSETLTGTVSFYEGYYTGYYFIKLNCSYQTSLGTTAYPYIGTLDGENVETYYKNNSETEKYKTTNACLRDGNTILNFVKTTSGDYVLCVVE